MTLTPTQRAGLKVLANRGSITIRIVPLFRASGFDCHIEGLPLSTFERLRRNGLAKREPVKGGRRYTLSERGWAALAG